MLLEIYFAYGEIHLIYNCRGPHIQPHWHTRPNTGFGRPYGRQIMEPKEPSYDVSMQLNHSSSFVCKVSL